MGSVQDGSETTQLLEENNVANFEQNVINEIDEFLKFGKQNKKVKHLKKKRKLEENIPPNILTEVFLRIWYPISSCMSKSVSIGLVKTLDYSPTVILNHNTKMVLFSENAWDSFLKHLHLIECYLTNSLFGRKTNIRLLDCDNEIDIVKHRGQQQVRIRNLTQHENKILLTREEFFILNNATSPITRYMKQLVFSSSVIKEYLVDACEKQPDSTIQYGPVDTSIFNRIPHEVEMWRQLRNYEPFTEIATEATEEEETKNEEEPVQD
jgi:hypothetical protein